MSFFKMGTNMASRFKMADYKKINFDFFENFFLKRGALVQRPRWLAFFSKMAANMAAIFKMVVSQIEKWKISKVFFQNAPRNPRSAMVNSEFYFCFLF